MASSFGAVAVTAGMNAIVTHQQARAVSRTALIRLRTTGAHHLDLAGRLPRVRSDG